MAESRVEDLASVDRDVARAWKALSRWRLSLARDVGAHDDEDPLESTRHVAGKATWDALDQLAPAAADAPLRDALRPWVYVLAQARIGRSDEVAWARAASEASGHFAGEQPRRVSWREAWRSVPAAKTPAETRLWLEAAAAAGPLLAAVSRRSAERRVEVARRLGVEHPWEPIARVNAGALRSAAHRLLDGTEDLAHAVRKERPTAGDGVAAVLHAAVGREAAHGWPARLGRRWLEDVVGGAAGGLRLDLPPLPAALGASSFARALYAFGFSLRLASSPAGTPFALAHDPGFRGAHRLGFVFARLTAEATWQARALGVGRRIASAQARVLAGAALLEVRLLAARLLLGDDAAPAPRDLFDELGPRLFGAPLDGRLRGAWPMARDDEAARFVALAESHTLSEALRGGFDVDWFRNPRAWSHLRASAAPAHEPVDATALSSQVEGIRRALEGALG